MFLDPPIVNTLMLFMMVNEQVQDSLFDPLYGSSLTSCCRSVDTGAAQITRVPKDTMTPQLRALRRRTGTIVHSYRSEHTDRNSHMLDANEPEGNMNNPGSSTK